LARATIIQITMMNRWTKKFLMIKIFSWRHTAPNVKDLLISTAITMRMELQDWFAGNAKVIRRCVLSLWRII
jgi:hypothetical protein